MRSCQCLKTRPLSSPPHSKILISKQKIIDLFPRIEKTLESIKDADNTVMQMQIKRQREFWHLLKIACVSSSQRPRRIRTSAGVCCCLTSSSSSLSASVRPRTRLVAPSQRVQSRPTCCRCLSGLSRLSPSARPTPSPPYLGPTTGNSWTGSSHPPCIYTCSSSFLFFISYT